MDRPKPSSLFKIGLLPLLATTQLASHGASVLQEAARRGWMRDRAKRHRLGGRYTGQELRMIRKEKGCGRPPEMNLARARMARDADGYGSLAQIKTEGGTYDPLAPRHPSD